jgi:hypothetical protein
MVYFAAFISGLFGPFGAGLLIGLCTGAVGVLFVLSQGAKDEDDGKVCKTCGR